jgi:hypothetical protein
MRGTRIRAQIWSSSTVTRVTVSQYTMMFHLCFLSIKPLFLESILCAELESELIRAQILSTSTVIRVTVSQHFNPEQMGVTIFTQYELKF